MMQDTDTPAPTLLGLSTALENSCGRQWVPLGWGPDVWALTEVHMVAGATPSREVELPERVQGLH